MTTCSSIVRSGTPYRSNLRVIDANKKPVGLADTRFISTKCRDDLFPAFDHPLLAELDPGVRGVLQTDDIDVVVQLPPRQRNEPGHRGTVRSPAGILAVAPSPPAAIAAALTGEIWLSEILRTGSTVCVGIALIGRSTMTMYRAVTLWGFAGLLGLGACGSSGSSGGGAYGGSATSAPAPASVKLAVASTAARGDVLVDGSGRTVYLFEKDTGTTSACTGGCASVWPAVPADGTVTGTAGVDAAKIGSAHGQVTYNGHLLYYFAQDTAAGDMKGVDIAEWYPVTPEGGSAEPK